MEHTHPPFTVIEQESTTNNVVELPAAKYQRVMRERRTLVNQADNPFDELDIMLMNHKRGLRDSQLDRVAYLQYVERRLKRRKELLGK